MQERIKLAPSQAHTYNNPAVNYLFVQATVTTFLVTEASAGVALAMSWQIQNRHTHKKNPLVRKCRQHKLQIFQGSGVSELVYHAVTLKKTFIDFQQ